MPITVVLDANFAMALFVPHPKAQVAHATYEQLLEANTTFIAPTLWLYEVTSTICKLAHFKEVSDEQANRGFDLARNFSIELIVPDFPLAQRALLWSQRLKRASAYDSFYLALAEERGCDLWTADGKLANAAKQSWVQLLT